MRVEIAGSEISAVVATLRKDTSVIVHLVVIDLADDQLIEDNQVVEIFGDDDTVWTGVVYRVVRAQIGAYDQGHFWTVLAIDTQSVVTDPTLILAFTDVEAAHQVRDGFSALLEAAGITYSPGMPHPGGMQDISGTLTGDGELVGLLVLAGGSRFVERQTDLWFRRSTAVNIFPVTIVKVYGPPPQIGRDGLMTNFWLYDVEWDNGGGSAPMVDERRIGFTEQEVDL